MKTLVKGILLIVAIVAVGGLVAHEAGYLPVKALLNIEEPKNSTLVDEEDYADIVVSIIEGIPEFERIKYSMFETKECPGEIMAIYHRQLEGNGYRVYNDVEGNGTFFEYNYSYAVYLKGITAVGIVAFSANDTTYVVYATGNGFDLDAVYQELMG